MSRAIRLAIDQHRHRLADALVGEQRRLADALLIPREVRVAAVAEVILEAIRLREDRRVVLHLVVLIGLRGERVGLAVAEHRQLGGGLLDLAVVDLVERPRRPPVKFVADELDRRARPPRGRVGHAVRAGADQQADRFVEQLRRVVRVERLVHRARAERDRQRLEVRPLEDEADGEVADLLDVVQRLVRRPLPRRGHLRVADEFDAEHDVVGGHRRAVGELHAPPKRHVDRQAVGADRPIRRQLRHPFERVRIAVRERLDDPVLNDVRVRVAAEQRRELRDLHGEVLNQPVALRVVRLRHRRELRLERRALRGGERIGGTRRRRRIGGGRPRRRHRRAAGDRSLHRLEQARLFGARLGQIAGPRLERDQRPPLAIVLEHREQRHHHRGDEQSDDREILHRKTLLHAILKLRTRDRRGRFQFVGRRYSFAASRFGSTKSRSPSPTKFSDSNVTASSRHGNASSHHCGSAGFNA